MSKFTDYISSFKKEVRSLESGYVNPIFGTLRFSTTGNYKAAKATKLSTVYRCINLLSDSIASMPIIPYTYKESWKYINYDDGLYNILNVQPNPYMSAYTFKKMIIVNLLTKGSAYILIDRNKAGKVNSLAMLNPDFITVQVIDNDLKYTNINSGSVYDKSQLIHILNYTIDGINGISTLEYAADSLGIAYSNEAHTSNFWKSGGNMSGILRPVAGATMNKTQAAAAKSSLITQLNTDLGGTSNSIVVLGDGLEYQPITVSPKDSQLIESRQFNVIEICRFFNVPPSLAFSESGKFSTAEQQSLDFLNNSLTPLIEKIESEMFRKLYLPSEWNVSELKFDVENLMRLDAVTKADYYSRLFNIGALTTNEVREKINANYPVKGGNRSFVQVNLQPTDALISEQVVINPAASVDNKVK